MSRPTIAQKVLLFPLMILLSFTVGFTTENHGHCRVETHHRLEEWSLRSGSEPALVIDAIRRTVKKGRKTLRKLGGRRQCSVAISCQSGYVPPTAAYSR